MFKHILLTSILLYSSVKFTVGCRENELASFSECSDLAVQLIKKVRDSKCGCPPINQPLDCEDVLKRGQTKSGIYKILPQSRIVRNPIEVYCDMDTDGGGWTVIQRRGNFTPPMVQFFYKDWQSYKEGFGIKTERFWLGNDYIFALTNQKDYSARFDLRDFEGNQTYAHYDTFRIDSEDHKYMLHIGGYSGNAGDSMTAVHNGMKFSTRDQKNDNEIATKENCAKEYKGAWWYNKCYEANLNGLYIMGDQPATTQYHDHGIVWYRWKNNNESLVWTEIKIRSRDFRATSGQ